MQIDGTLGLASLQRSAVDMIRDARVGTNDRLFN